MVWDFGNPQKIEQTKNIHCYEKKKKKSNAYLLLIKTLPTVSSRLFLLFGLTPTNIDNQGLTPTNVYLGLSQNTVL